jgi:hypothetical protein
MQQAARVGLGNQLRARPVARSEPVAMPEKKRGKLETSREGLNLANVLRESLLCALIVLNPEERISLLAGETEELLGIKQQRASGYSIKDLPDPVQKLARDAMASGRATLDRAIK